MSEENNNDSNFKRSFAAIKQQVGRLADKGSKTAKRVESQQDTSRSSTATLMRRLVMESIDMFEDGEATMSEMIEDLTKTLQDIPDNIEEEILNN